VAQYPQRRAANVFVPRVTVEAEIGFSLENVGAAFGGLEALCEQMRSGAVRGIVNLVGCNNPKLLYEKAVCDVADSLLAASVLVLTNGCASFALLKLGYCTADARSRVGAPLQQALAQAGLPAVLHMGECLDNARASGLFRALADTTRQPIHAMPFAFASPEWSNEKGVGAALGFRLLGVPSYHCLHAPIGGSERVSRYFSDDTQGELGAVMTVEVDPLALARRIVADIDRRRQALGWAMPSHLLPADPADTALVR
jgi:carbon-monoxide dehydrogenase catalytic subunit